MTNEEIKKQSEEYGYAEVNKLLKANENCHTHFTFSKADISKAFKDGAKYGMEQICKTCEKRLKELDRPCAYRSLGNDYCWE